MTILGVSLSSGRYTKKTKMMLCKDLSIYREGQMVRSSLSLELMSLTKFRAVL